MRISDWSSDVCSSDLPAGEADIAVAVHGFVGEDNREAKATYLRQETQMFEFLSVETGRSMMPGAGRVRGMERGGMVFAGSPNEVADRILHLHERLGHSRQIIQMDVGGMPHEIGRAPV